MSREISSTNEHIPMKGGLARALERGELAIHFQPKIDMKPADGSAGLVVGYEALLRWQSPIVGSISPGDFLSWAERSNEVRTVGYWVADQSLKQLAAWRTSGLATPYTRMSINLLGRQLNDPLLLDELLAAVERYGLKPDDLELEVTEATLDEETAGLDALRLLKEASFRIHLDDFGAGYSSLSYLHRFPFDCVKIDRTVVADMDRESQSLSLTKTVVALGHKLKLEVIAEGVETAEHVSMLLEMGCNLGQGFYFARPMPAVAIERWLLAEPAQQTA
ncbi:putative bifunctional diguanylate cyclase/phosphodiesterase [Terriglobus tenax]|uniref:putative bifunctional diguanylate cyclase/phosphodiesterase n=1 Tax=Terriglobus tenax TaxID=1111115 RepID=UPI0021E02809|nr:EAL domain-containing protein [Terriglobus tenax]